MAITSSRRLIVGGDFQVGIASMHWTGAFHFGDYWAAYRGPAGDNTPHAHAALQITFGLSNDAALVDVSGARFVGRALITRAGAYHTLEKSDDVVVILCDPTSAAAASLKELCRNIDITLVPDAIAELFPVSGPLSGLMDQFAISPPPIDPRLRAALDFLERKNGRHIEAAAEHCGLSPARLRAIAAAQMGIPLTRWQSWRMLRRAGLALAEGASLATAAQIGGFADQSHFSRTMRSMTGLTPSAALEPLSPASDRFKT